MARNRVDSKNCRCLVDTSIITWVIQLWEKPVILLRDREGALHIIDGHHRALAAIKSGRRSLAADVYSDNVFRKAINTMKETAEETKEMFARRDKDDSHGDKRKIYMMGFNNPTSGLNSDRTELVDEDKPPRPEAFN